MPLPRCCQITPSWHDGRMQLTMLWRRAKGGGESRWEDQRPLHCISETLLMKILTRESETFLGLEYQLFPYYIVHELVVKLYRCLLHDWRSYVVSLLSPEVLGCH